MARPRPTPPTKQPPAPAPREIAPPRKRPLLLALSVVLLLAWLAFMVVMAWRSLT
jgi:hypothetical protein